MRRVFRCFVFAIASLGSMPPVCAGGTVPLDGLDPGKAITQFGHDNWGIDDGLPQDSVTAVVQTRDGYLWIGTDGGGLVRFDGVRFVTFNRQNTPELSNDFIVTLLEDRHDNLWIGTYGGGLVRMHAGAMRAFTTRDGLISDVVYSLHENRSGALWIGTEGGGLHRLSGEKVSPVPILGTFSRHGISSIQEDREGNLWVGSFGGGLGKFDATGRITRLYTKKDGLAHDSVRAILPDGDGLWIGTSGGGLDRLANGRFTNHSTTTGLTDNVIRTIVKDRRGTLWIGSDHGISRLSGETFTSYSTRDGLPNNIVTALWEDREGSLWAGTSGGLFRLRDGKFTTYTEQEGIASEVVRSIAEDRDGSIWMGTFGGVSHITNGVSRNYTMKDGLSSNVVTSVLPDGSGGAWIGTRGGGLCRLQGDRVAVYLPKDGLAYDAVRALFIDRRGDLWIGTDGGGISRFRDGRFTNYTTKDGLSSNFIRVIHESRDGTIRAGTEGRGLNRFSDGRFRLEGDATRQRDTIFSIVEDASGALWLGTYGSGLIRYKDGRFASCSTREGLFDDTIFTILDDGAGSFWMGGTKGVSRVSKRELDDVLDHRIRRVHADAFGTGDGMKSSKCNGGSQPSGWIGSDGRVWFPTMKGAAVIDPRRIRVNTQPPPVLIEEITADGVARPFHEQVTIAPGSRKLAFRYTALSFLAPSRVVFKYRLDGFETEWNDAATQRTATYTNLPPGKYRFRVIASNSDGVWNARGVSADLVLQPFFHQTIWFKVLVAFLALAAAVTMVRLRLRQLRASQRMLMALVDERTKELTETNEELGHANAALRDANQLKMDLLRIVAHDLRNPLQAISGFAEIIGEQSGKESPIGKKAGVISTAAQEMLDIITDLLESVAIDTDQIELETRMIDMGRLAAMVVANHEDAARRKGQTLLLDAGDGGLVRADEHRLREVMDNLISNAIKYSPRRMPIQIRVTRAESEVLFQVEDQGPGLTEDDRKKVFGRFQRLSARPTAGESSLGLGLSIARQFIELQGGRIWVENEQEVGSTFVIALPIADAADSSGVG